MSQYELQAASASAAVTPPPPPSPPQPNTNSESTRPQRPPDNLRICPPLGLFACGLRAAKRHASRYRRFAAARSFRRRTNGGSRSARATRPPAGVYGQPILERALPPSAAAPAMVRGRRTLRTQGG